MKRKDFELALWRLNTCRWALRGMVLAAHYEGHDIEQRDLENVWFDLDHVYYTLKEAQTRGDS
jgi:hypothetical protein